MLHIVAISDCHGTLPVYLPKADVLVIGGDLEPDNSPIGQADWYKNTFSKWIEKRRHNYKEVIMHAGNHSFGLESYHYRETKESDSIAEIIDSLPVKTIILGEITIDGYLFLVNSYCLQVGWWAFGWTEDDYARWAEKHNKCDVLLCHGPPKGMLDSAYRYLDNDTIGHEATGSAELASWVMRVKPKVIICNHIHESFGTMDIQHYSGEITKIANVSQSTRSLRYEYRPVEIFLQ